MDQNFNKKSERVCGSNVINFFTTFKDQDEDSRSSIKPLNSSTNQNKIH